VEELGAGLEVGDAAVEVKGMLAADREFVGKEGVSEGVAANGLTKGAGTGGELGGRSKKLESLVEEGGMVCGEGRGGGASDGGEEFCLGEAEENAMGATKAIKLGDVEGEVFIAEAGAGVINVREVSGGREGVGTGGSTGGKGEVEASQYFMEDKAGKEGTEGAALGETFSLEEGSPGGILGMVPANVGRVVEHVKEGEKAGEGGVVGENGTARLTRNRVEHVDIAKEEEGMGGGCARSFQVGNVGLNSSTGEVNDGVKTARDADTKLALWEEVGSKVGAEECLRTVEARRRHQEKLIPRGQSLARLVGSLNSAVK
jgi:hypothetical protein